MKKYVICLVLLASMSALATDSSSIEFWSRFGEKVYSYKIDSTTLKRQPKWNPEKQHNPPLSAARALRKANAFISKFEPPANHAWHLESLSLMDLGGWVWRAKYTLQYSGTSTGPPEYLDSFILMDGTVLQPTVVPVKH